MGTADIINVFQYIHASDASSNFIQLVTCVIVSKCQTNSRCIDIEIRVYTKQSVTDTMEILGF